MAEESRGKRRKQANPRRNQVGITCALSSEGEDDPWGHLQAQDGTEQHDKTSLTPSEGTEPGSPARGARAGSLSPQAARWSAADPHAASAAARRSAQLSRSESEESRVLDGLAHFDFLAQLRKASHQPSHPDNTPHNPSLTMYPSPGYHDNTPPTGWSPVTEEPPEGRDGAPLSPGGMRVSMPVCPFCQRAYRHDASLREHMKVCQERGEGRSVCPLCGYTATHRAQMERHVALHNQAEDKNPVTDNPMENRKFKCVQCGKAFKYKHHLKEHLRIHSGEKPYECANCKKRFSHSGSYSSHLSSKKCLNGGASSRGGPDGSMSFNGHSHHPYPLSSPTSPPVGVPRNGGGGKGSPFAGQFLGEHPLSLAQERGLFPPRGGELGRLWGPSADVALRASVFKGTTLLPYLHSGGKFEQLLQEMLRREMGREEEEERAAREEQGDRDWTGGGEGKDAPNGVRVGEVQLGPVACRWCSQLCPSVAMLVHHERHLCKMSREAAEAPPLPRTLSPSTPSPSTKDSSPLNFSRASQQSPDALKTPPAIPNGFPRDESPLRRASWHSVPQQLLVPLPSPVQFHPEPLPSHSYWPDRDTGSPRNTNPMGPGMETASLREKRRVPPSGFGSPVCIDLRANALTPPRGYPPPLTPGSAGSQSEPLDLSLPKAHPAQTREQLCNGDPQRRDSGLGGGFRRLTPPPRQQQQPVTAYPGTPIFGGSVYGGYPLFNPMLPSGLTGAGHESLPSLSLSQSVPSPGFLSPMAFMLEADTETVLKRIQQERRAMMGEALNRGCLDYLSLVEEGMDGEMTPGRKRLRKTEEGLYACDICDKTFQKSSSLLRHKYEHTGKRPHECKLCKKAFKHKHHLIEHSRLHSGEKPYQCDKCGKRFSHSGSYSQHMNHRYAFCSRDLDADAPGEEPLFGDSPPAPRPATPLAETPTLLSDSSLDGAPGRLREEGEERDEDGDISAYGEDRQAEDGKEDALSHGEGKDEGKQGPGEEENHRGNQVRMDLDGEANLDSCETNVDTIEY